MRKAPLGDLELDILTFLTEHAPLSVGEAFAKLGETRHLARTTVLTVMENLRKKGYVTREKEEGVFRYRPKADKSQVLKEMVQDFVQKTLSGSLSPFFAYISETQQFSPEEEAELRRLVEKLPKQQETDES